MNTLMRAVNLLYETGLEDCGVADLAFFTTH